MTYRAYGNYRPFGSLVALHVIKTKRTRRGLQLPDGSSVSSGGTAEVQKGIVVAAGPECKQLKAGDATFFHQATTCCDVMVDGYVTTLVREDSLGGVLTEESLSPQGREELQEARAEIQLLPDR